MDSAKQILPEWKHLLHQKEQNYKLQGTFLTQRWAIRKKKAEENF